MRARYSGPELNNAEVDELHRRNPLLMLFKYSTASSLEVVFLSRLRPKSVGENNQDFKNAATVLEARLRRLHRTR
jgi:hypothetical protein